MFKGGKKSKQLSDCTYNNSNQDESLLALMNNLPDGVLKVDKLGVIELYNASVLNILDTNITLTDHNIEDIVQIHNTKGENLDILKLLKKAKKITVYDDIVYGFETGEELRLELTITPIHTNDVRANISGYIVLMRDITKLKSLEQERDEFISVVSHELRTPVTVIEATMSNLSLVLERGATMDVLRDIVKMAHDQSIYLARMLNDIASLGRAERTDISLDDTVELQSFMNDTYNKYNLEAEKKGLVMNLDLPPKLGSIITSKLYLEELMQNFITNAIKYTNEGSVTIGIIDSDDNYEFYIKDTGIGIPKTDRDKIYQKFYRVEDYRTRETSGTGIGLYVNNRLAQKLKTKIDLQSRLNHGSTFSFKIKK